MNTLFDGGITKRCDGPSVVRLLTIASLLMATACVSVKPPTKAHTHIGHAVTGWYDTPNKIGLLNTAEAESERGHAQARLAAAATSDPAKLRDHVRMVLNAFDPERAIQELGQAGESYGACRALDGALSHLEFAANSDDATTNVRKGVGDIVANTRDLIERCRLVADLSMEILRTNSDADAIALTEELPITTGEVLYGTDSNGDGVVGDEPTEIGISLIRREIDQMTAREEPPYSPVATRWLFSLIKLDDGTWVFSKSDPGRLRGY
jgi:hypothetical protein